jgi:hypothetical protein
MGIADEGKTKGFCLCRSKKKNKETGSQQKIFHI